MDVSSEFCFTLTPSSTALTLQAKRTNIGIALITNPRVLFLDEPTSGLDSYTSNEVMTVVKALLEDGTTICATIHSPSQVGMGAGKDGEGGIHTGMMRL